MPCPWSRKRRRGPLPSKASKNKTTEKIDCDKCTKPFNFSADTEEETPPTGDEEEDGEAKRGRKRPAPSEQVSFKNVKHQKSTALKSGKKFHLFRMKRMKR